MDDVGEAYGRRAKELFEIVLCEVEDEITNESGEWGFRGKRKVFARGTGSIG